MVVLSAMMVFAQTNKFYVVSDGAGGWKLRVSGNNALCSVVPAAPTLGPWRDPYSNDWWFCYHMITTNAVDPVSPDSSTNNFDLTVNLGTANEPLYVLSNATTLAHYDYDGIDDYSWVSQVNFLNNPTSMTLSVWVFDESTNNPTAFFARQFSDNTKKQFYLIRQSLNGAMRLCFAVHSEDATNHIGRLAPYPGPNQWYNFTATWNGYTNDTSGIDLYIDGVLSDNDDYVKGGFYGFTTHLGSIWIGNTRPTQAGWRHDGDMYRNVFYRHRVLTSNEVYTMWQHTHPTNNYEIRP
jgi:hypothetical protein